MEGDGHEHDAVPAASPVAAAQPEAPRGPPAGSEVKREDGPADEAAPAAVKEEEHADTGAPDSTANGQTPANGKEADAGEEEADAEEEGADEGEDDEDEEEDDEEDDEDEEDEEDEDEDGGKSRRKKQRRNRFLDVEAEVDNDEEDVDDEEAEELMREDGFIADDAVDETRDAQMRTHADNQRLDLTRRQEEEMSAEALAEELRQRHARNNRYSAQSDYAEVPQRMLMPSVDDPGLWRIRCKRGRERHLVATVMRKALAHEASGKPLRILSAFCRDSLEGQIFVEARRADDVTEAFRGLAGAYVMNSKPFLVPILEMADLLKLQKKQSEIPVGGWVRVRRGKYAGDLAQVLDVAENGEEVGVKLVPRIDMNPTEADMYVDRAGRKRKKNTSGVTSTGFRPPQHLFNAEEVQKAYPGELPIKRGGAWVFGGETYRDGYLEKDFRTTALLTEDINPSLDEVLRFTGESSDAAEGGAGVDLHLLANASKGGPESLLQPGDHVEVFEGEQAGVQGVIEAYNGEVATLESRDEALEGQRIEVPARSIRKMFRPGDHIKVLAGKHKDETGLVVKVESGVTTFLSDLSLREVSVFSKDIREAAEVGSGVNVIGEYELHNLVQLDTQTVGVIFKIERESFKVLDQYGQVVSVKPHQISMRRDSARTVALDHNGHEVHVGDMVKETEWQLSQFRQGQVIHIFRSTVLFLYNREYTENGGIFVVQSNQVEPLAPTGGKPSGPDPSKMNPALKALESGNTAGGANAVSGGRRGGRDFFAGKSVAIVRGPYKTYRGMIKESNGGQARIELQTASKIITVPLDHLVEKNPVTGESRRLVGPGAHGPPGGMPPPMAPANPYAAMPPPGGMTPAYGAGGRTPAYNPYGGGQTPAYGGRTPAYGGQTPAYGGMGRTPNPYGGGQTPAYGGMGQTPNPYAGGQTPAYGGMGRTPNPYGGGQTPAYGGMGRTPNPYGGGQTPAYGGMGQTPNPYSGGRTPAYGGMGQTPNPYGPPGPPPAPPTANPWAAPTPGAPVADARPTAVLEGMRVRIARDADGTAYQRGAYDGNAGQVTARNPVSCKVVLDAGTQLADVPLRCVEPLRPSGAEGEACIVVEGVWQGSRVHVQSHDGNDFTCTMGDGSSQTFPAHLLALT